MKSNIIRALWAEKKSITLLLAFVAMVMIGCKEPHYLPNPGEVTIDSIPPVVLPDPTPDPEGADVPDSCLTVYEARQICSKLADGATTGKKYYVKGWISELDAKNNDGIISYGNATFYMAATNDGQSNNYPIEAYQVMGKDGKKIGSVDEVKVGDFVVIYGELTNFKGTYETVGKGAANIYYSSNPDFDPKEDPTKVTPDPEGADVPAGTMTVYEARQFCDTLGKGKTSTEEYYVKGWVRRFDSKHESGMEKYGNGTFYIAPTNDGSTDAFTFEAYQVFGKDKAKFTSLDQVAIGDFVVLKGKLTNYNGTAETVGKGAAYVYYSTNPNW